MKSEFIQRLREVKEELETMNYCAEIVFDPIIAAEFYHDLKEVTQTLDGIIEFLRRFEK